MCTFRMSVISLVILITAAFQLNAQNNFGIEDAGRIFDWWEYGRNLVLDGHYLHVSTGSTGHRIIDISDPENPVEVCRIDHIGEDFYIVDNHLFALTNVGIGIFDLEDIENPTLINTIEGFDIRGEFHVSGDILFIPNLVWIDRNAIFQIRLLNISDPFNLVELGLIDTLRSFQFVTNNNYAYIYSGNSETGLVIVDYNDPEFPRKVGSITDYGSSLSLWKLENLLCISNYDSLFVILDLQNPENPQELFRCAGIPKPSDIVKQGNYLYYVDHVEGDGHDDGIGIIDINNPESPEFIRTFYADETDRLSHFISTANHMYLIRSSYPQLMILDCSDPVNLSTITHYEGRGVMEDFDIINNNALLTYDGYCVGLSLYDITSLSEPHKLSHLKIFETAQYPRTCVNGNVIYTWAGSWGLTISELTDEVELTFRAHLDGMFNDISFYNNNMFAAAGRNGVVVYQLDNPFQPTAIDTLIVEQNFQSVLISANDGIVVSVDRNNELEILRVIDNSVPSDLNLLSSTRIALQGGSHQSIEFDGRFVNYIEDNYSRSIKFVDVSNPHEPVIIGGFGFSAEHNSTFRLTLGSRYVLRAISNMGLTAYRYFVNPAGILGWEIIGRFNYDSYYPTFMLHDFHYVFVSDRFSIKVFDISEIIPPVKVAEEDLNVPSQINLNAFPNPFNSSTTIEYRVGANSNSPVTLSIYDISGQLVENLVNQYLSPGNYSIVWDANRFASGIYFVKFYTKQELRTAKLVMLK